MKELSKEELTELIEDLEKDWEESQKTIANTFVILKQDKNNINVLCCGNEGDQVIFNRLDSRLRYIPTKRLKSERLYDIIGSYLEEESYSLIGIPIPNGEIEEFFCICRAVSNHTGNTYKLKNGEVAGLINKLQPSEYATLIIKED